MCGHFLFYISTDLCQIIAFFSVVPVEHVIEIAVIVIPVIPVIIVVITIVPVTVIHSLFYDTFKSQEPEKPLFTGLFAITRNPKSRY